MPPKGSPIDYRNIEADTLKNSFYRQVVYTVGGDARECTDAPRHGVQLVLMSLVVGETIPCEIHHKPSGAQFIRVESGSGTLTIDTKEQKSLVYQLANGVSVTIPNGLNHCIANTSKTETLKQHTIRSKKNKKKF